MKKPVQTLLAWALSLSAHAAVIVALIGRQIPVTHAERHKSAGEPVVVTVTLMATPTESPDVPELPTSSTAPRFPAAAEPLQTPPLSTPVIPIDVSRHVPEPAQDAPRRLIELPEPPPTHPSIDVDSSQVPTATAPPSPAPPSSESVNRPIEADSVSSELPALPVQDVPATLPTQQATPPAPTGFDRRAAVTKLPQPGYPTLSVRNREEGLVVLEVQVLADGSTGRIKVVKRPRFDRLVDAAIEAAKKAQFTPAKREGTPVDDVVRIPYRFRLQ